MITRIFQIRGQLAATGYPLVGDVQYDGAVPNTSEIYKERCKERDEGKNKAYDTIRNNYDENLDFDDLIKQINVELQHVFKLI